MNQAPAAWQSPWGLGFVKTNWSVGHSPRAGWVAQLGRLRLPRAGVLRPERARAVSRALASVVSSLFPFPSSRFFFPFSFLAIAPSPVLSCSLNFAPFPTRPCFPPVPAASSVSKFSAGNLSLCPGLGLPGPGTGGLGRRRGCRESLIWGDEVGKGSEHWLWSPEACCVFVGTGLFTLGSPWIPAPGSVRKTL